MTRAWRWLYANDYRMLVAIVVAQAGLLLAFIWFTHWISDYARLNWY